MKKMLDVVFILDKSGSMSGSEENTISSFNEYLEKEKKNPFETRVTTVLFSDSYKMLYKRNPIKNVKPLTEKEYYVGGCTALYDALGNTISYMKRQNPTQVLFIVITDGYENASKEYNKDKIKRMIESHSDWEFIYIGADIDSYAAGGELGIKASHIANFRKSKNATAKMFGAIQNFECAMMCEKSITPDWKEDLEEYIENNKD